VPSLAANAMLTLARLEAEREHFDHAVALLEQAEQWLREAGDAEAEGRACALRRELEQQYVAVSLSSCNEFRALEEANRLFRDTSDMDGLLAQAVKLAVEHSLENGRLIVWVDGVLALETRLRAETAKKSGGRLERVLDVDPGRHEVKVEVSWDEKRRLETQIVDVAPETTGRLSVRLGGLIKGLGLEWTFPAP